MDEFLFNLNLGTEEMTVYSDCEPFELTANLELREVLVCNKADKMLTLCTSPTTSGLRHWNK